MTSFPESFHACPRSLDVGRARRHDQQPIGADLGRASKALIGYRRLDVYGGRGNYFFMVGSAAAPLIGLMFIVAMLTAGRDRSQFEPGKKLYTSPIVWHLGVVLVLSGAAIARP